MNNLSKNWRSDIGALRGVAVLLVVLNHTSTPGFSFGFIGVDIFFVISGYLITRSLYIEYLSGNKEKNSSSGSIKILSFYLRRIRRLMPAAITVIIIVNMVSRFAFNATEQTVPIKDSLASIFFAMNIFLISAKTDYFQLDNQSSYLQHYWSLSVEEQFYVFIPLIFLLCAFSHRMRFKGRYIRFNLRFLSLLLIITFGSFLFLQINFSTLPTETFFSLLSRAWELGVGAIFGILAYHKKTTTEFSNIERILPLLISIIVSSMYILNTNWARFILLPVVATGFFLYAGEGANIPPREKKKKQPLYFRLLSYLGKISYSLYLVHWPLIVFFHKFIQSGGFINKGLIICSSIILGHLLWIYIETPFQRIRITNKLNALDSTIFDRGRKRKEVIFGIPAVLILLMYISTFPSNLSWAQNNSNLAKSANSNTFLKPFADYENQLVQGSNSQILGELDASKRPDALPNQSLDLLKNTLDDLVQSNTLKLENAMLKRTIPNESTKIFQSRIGDISPFESGSCARGDRDANSICVFKSPNVGTKKRVVLIGDSKLAQFTGPIIDYFLPKNWDVYSYSMVGCNPLGSLSTKCSDRLEWGAQQVASENFDLLIFTGYPSNEVNLSTQNYLVKLIKDSKKTILLGTFPTVDNNNCINKDLQIDPRCETIVPRLVTAYRKTNLLFKSLEASNISYIDTSAWTCINLTCPIIIDNTFTTRDGSHLTYAMLKKITPILYANLDVLLL